MKVNEIREKFKKLGYNLDKGKDCHIPLEYYTKENGEFDYDLYSSVQDQLNSHKIHIKGPVFDQNSPLVLYIKKYITPIKFGICHGSRRGDEQNSLSKIFNIKVLGTDIASSATKFKNTIQWDFHEIKDSWVNNVSFIFSNSLDHSYDPYKAINNWMKCLHKGGGIFIDMSEGHVGLKSKLLNNKFWEEKKYDGKMNYNIADCFHTKKEVIKSIMEDINNVDYRFSELKNNLILIKKIK